MSSVGERFSAIEAQNKRLAWIKKRKINPCWVTLDGGRSKDF